MGDQRERNRIKSRVDELPDEIRAQLDTMLADVNYTYYAAMVSYQKTGKNKHDDAPDATTGIAETIQEREGRGTLDIWWV